LRQLLWMAEGLGRERWSHTAAVMALIANVNRDPKKGRAFRPSDFDPFSRKTRTDYRRIAGKEDLKLLREALEGRKGD